MKRDLVVIKASLVFHPIVHHLSVWITLRLTRVYRKKRLLFQRQQNRIVELLAHNQNRSKLPQPRVPVFDGNPMEYRTFVRALESLVESRTFCSTDRLYYLEQFTAGDVRELVRSCHHLLSDEGYDEARRLLKKKFGDEYRIASAYETKAMDWPNIKPEDGVALNRFSVFLTSCRISSVTQRLSTIVSNGFECHSELVRGHTISTKKLRFSACGHNSFDSYLMFCNQLKT